MAEPPISYSVLANSTSLDFTSYRGNGTLPPTDHLHDSFSFNVALVLERANDPTALLQADWASRQQQLAALDQNGTLWSTYGADPARYHDARTALADMGFILFPEGAGHQYVSSAESRTIWLHVDKTNFTTLFGPDAALRSGHDESGNLITFWEGNLSLPDSLIAAGVKGVMFDTPLFASVLADPGTGALVDLPQGPQSAGNAIPQVEGIFPNDLAALYDFPFNSAATPDWWKTVQTGPIGLLEPNLGTALPSGSDSFRDLADTYRRRVGLDAHGDYREVAPGGASGTTSGERSLDVGIATTVSPTSPLVLYAGSGTDSDAHSAAYTAYQAAFWDDVNKPRVVSSSYRDHPHIAPDSPFYFAYRELFVDAALRNITAVNAVGDDGSGDQLANGLTNVDVSHASPYSIVAGGTSLSSLQAATLDPTLQAIAAAATAGDPATIWQLVAGGLTALPSSAGSGAADTIARLIETVWNTYFVFGNNIVDKENNGGGYNNNFTSSGGVDPSRPQPSYQTDFGLNLATADPDALPGRGVPDVSALAGGNLKYNVPLSDMTGLGLGAGTSAAAPLWAALVAQFNAIFQDQGLPPLGYMNDLLYIAAAVAPAAFNDVQLGSNTSSFRLGGPYRTPPEDGSDPTQHVTPTGFGYSAGPGYDLTSGLGTPNGILLGRALTAIAHRQMSFATNPDVVEIHESGHLTTPVAETLLIQAMSDSAMSVAVLAGSDSLSFISTPAAPFAWTSLLAQQSLQPDFDPGLARMFDVQSQGVLAQTVAEHGDRLEVSIEGTGARAPQVALTSPFGFVDFVSATGDSAVRVARPIAVAETAGGLDDQHAVVRIRQNGQDSVALKLYRVDDFNGTIDGLHPGDAGYQAAVLARAYQTTSGATSIDGPGFGNYGQTELRQVNAGDLVAMQLVNRTTGNTYSAFSQANEIVDGQPIGHLWNYGLNTWGWEDTRGGGDRDYNDLIVGIDFTSASGNGWLV